MIRQRGAPLTYKTDLKENLQKAYWWNDGQTGLGNSDE